MKIRPIKRVRHEEWEGKWCPSVLPNWGGHYQEAGAKVVWETCFGRVIAFRSCDQKSLWITRESVPEGIEFPLMKGNIVEIHEMLQRIHDTQMLKFLVPETRHEYMAMLPSLYYSRQGMVRREGVIEIAPEIAQELSEHFKQQLEERQLQMFQSQICPEILPIAEVQIHRQLGTRVVYGAPKV